MDFIPLAFDSMGVRSMCCFIQSEPTILVDPGVSLAPRRFGLPPHQTELDQLMKKRQIIQDYAQKADIVTISHWHNDHHTPFIKGLYGSVTPELARVLYRGKAVLGKAMTGLNFMQRKRALSCCEKRRAEFSHYFPFKKSGRIQKRNRERKLENKRIKFYYKRSREKVKRKHKKNKRSK